MKLKGGVIDEIRYSALGNGDKQHKKRDTR